MFANMISSLKNKREAYQFHNIISGNKKQPLIILLHGFMGSSDDFHEVIELLSEEFCCLAVDLPGHGKTQVKGDESCYNMSNTAQGINDLLDELKMDKCSLVGYSMGGRLALYLMLNFPDRFEKVILESATAGLKTAAERKKRRQADAERARELENGDFRQFLGKWYNQAIFQSLRNHPDFGKMMERRLANHPWELAKSLRNMGTGNMLPLWDRLAENKIPLLLLVGEYDAKFKAINAEMASLCEVAQLQIVAQAGHNIHLENPGEWVKQVTRLLG
ncbi:MAG: 2-succinyl-6-hydroxy-2,4-cyclohexadiene-1-carboxylate synthase [Hormoscilla sp.]